MARVRDYFAQRNRGAEDTEQDESPPETKEEAKEEKPQENPPDVLSYPESRSKSEHPLFDSETQEGCTKRLDALRDASPTCDSTSVTEPKKSESNNLADLAALTAGESATNVSDRPLYSDDEPALAECMNISGSVSEAEEKSQTQGTSYKCANSPADERADSVISAVISDSLVSQTTSFTFGTVVAPLYHQMFGRAGSESQSVGEGGDSVWATLNTGDLTQHHPYSERKESHCTVSPHGRNDNHSVQGDVIKTQETNQHGSDVTPKSLSTEEEQIGVDVTVDDILGPVATQQDPDENVQPDQSCTNASDYSKPLSVDTESHPHSAYILHGDLLIAQVHAQSLHLQGETQEDYLTSDHNKQTTAERPQAQLPENTCSQIKASQNKALSQTEAPEVAGRETSRLPLEPSQSESESVNDAGAENDSKYVDESNMEDDSGKIIMISTATASPSPFEPFHDVNPNEVSDSAAKETARSYIYCSEIVKGKDFSKPDNALENQTKTSNTEEQNKLTNNSYEYETKHSAEIEVNDEKAESSPQEMITNFHVHGDMFVELKDEDALKDEPVVVSEEVEDHEIAAAVLKQRGVSLADTTEVKNWEMMVEEEEENTFRDQEECEAISLKAVDKDQGGQLVETGMETTPDTTEKKAEELLPLEEPVEELTATEGGGTKAEDDDVEGKNLSLSPRGEEAIWEIVAGEDLEDVYRELVQATKKEEEEEEVAEEVEVEKRGDQEETEMQKENHFAEMQEVTIKRTSVQEEETEAQEEMEISLNDGSEVGVEEENPNKSEEIVADQAGDSEVVDAASQGITIEDDGRDEVECYEERLDITQHKAEDGLSAPVNVQDKSVIDKEKTGGSAHIPTEMHLYKEEGFQSGECVPHDRSKAEMESCTPEGDLCILTDEPKNDQTSQDSTSGESDSDDEVELYMHCLRAVHAGEQAAKDRIKDTAQSAGKRPSISRGKLLSTPMPSITESLDEEQQLPCLHEDVDVADLQPSAAAVPLSGEQEITTRNVSWWKETFSCSNISKTLLYTTLLVVFLVVSYHYDFLACFGLYLISVVWLCCQGERPQVKNNNRIG